MKYSFVVPIYNDGALAQDFCREIEAVFRAYVGREDLEGNLEVIFVDDGSANDSPELVKQACREYRFAKLLALSRNFGQHIAISAGYRASRGEFVGTLNVDQEDPPRELPRLLDTLKSSPQYDIIGGYYEERKVPFVSKLTSHLFHVTMNRLTGHDMPANSACVRIMTRHSVDLYNSLTETARYLPGLEAWLGLRYGRIPVAHQPRTTGKSSYNFQRRLRMAVMSFISFSDFPLRLAVKFGFLVAFMGLVLSVALVADKLFGNAYLPGYISTVAGLAILSGVQLTVTGIASLYVGRVLAEVQGRPLYVVRETFDPTLTDPREA